MQNIRDLSLQFAHDAIYAVYILFIA